MRPALIPKLNRINIRDARDARDDPRYPVEDFDSHTDMMMSADNTKSYRDGAGSSLASLASLPPEELADDFNFDRDTIPAQGAP
jgi:hypothetical protein